MTTQRTPTAPSRATLKRLFARSGNRCAFPRCTEAIIQGSTVVGEICHIRAANPDGPRYDAHQPPAERHGYDNLILLCGTHHTVVDDDVEAYTVERLIKMKAAHETQSTAIDDNLADQASLLLVSQPVTTINQRGGITAHTINLTVNSARLSTRATKSWILEPVKGHVSAFISDGETLCRPRSLFDREEPVDIRWQNRPQFFLRLIPSEPHAQMRHSEAKQLIDSARLRPLPKWDYMFSAINKFGAVSVNSENVERQSAAAQISQVSTFGEIWGIDTRMVVRDSEIRFGEKTICGALADYLTFARDLLALESPLILICGLTGVEGYGFRHPYDPRRVMFEPPLLPCSHPDIVWQGEISDLSAEPTDILRPFFDHVWDCCGLTRQNWFPEEYK